MTRHPADERTPHTAPPPPSAPRRRLVRLTLAEVRRLLNIRHQRRPLIHQALEWSTYRRRHQGEARRHHFARRLKRQTLAL